jgi:hypothetical protein
MKFLNSETVILPSVSIMGAYIGFKVSGEISKTTGSVAGIGHFKPSRSKLVH